MDANYLTDVLEHLLGGSKGRLAKSEVMQHLTDFKHRMRFIHATLSVNEKNAFNRVILSTIKDHHEYLLNEPNSELICLCDQLHAYVLRDVQIHNNFRKVNKAFNYFLKGITCFGNEIPIYQPGPIQNRNSLDASNAMNKSLRTCYIEHLVYDELWVKLIKTSQDLRYTEWLGETRMAYLSLFPKDIFIEIEFTSDNVPIVLKVYDDNIIEYYEKSYDKNNKLYNNLVICYQTDEATGIQMRKRNTFTQDNEWVVISS